MDFIKPLANMPVLRHGRKNYVTDEHKVIFVAMLDHARWDEKVQIYLRLGLDVDIKWRIELLDEIIQTVSY